MVTQYFNTGNSGECEQKVETLISNLPGVVYRCKIDKSWSMLFLSDGIKELTGYAPEDFLNNSKLTYSDIIHQEDKERVWEIILKEISKKQPYTLEYRIKDAMGNEKWVWERGCAVPDIAAKTWVLEGFILDISHQKKSEQKLLESQKQLMMTMEQCPAVIYMCKVGIGKDIYDVTVEYVSENISEILGYEPKHFINDSEFWLRCIHPDDCDSVFSKLNVSLEQGDSISHTYRFKNIFDNYCWLNDKQKVYEKSDGYIRIIGSWIDITKQKFAEQDIIEKNAQLTEINNEKDKLFSLIAHDLRSPFGAFLGLIETIVEKADIMKPEKIQEIAVAMYDTATNLYRLIENLLDWTKIQRHGVKYQPQTYLILPLYVECVKLYTEQAKKKNISLVTHIDSSLEIFADADMLKTIIRNLMSNAVKFTQHGGFVTVSAKKSINRTVDIIVQDTGIGMDSNSVDNLFKVDRSSRRYGTDGEPSTGLGLIICKEYVKIHGGTIRVESIPDKGTTFFISFPAHQ